MWKEKCEDLINRKENEIKSLLLERDMEDEYFKEEVIKLKLELESVKENLSRAKKEIELSGVYIPDNFSLEDIDFIIKSSISKINEIEEKRIFEKYFGSKNPKTIKEYEDAVSLYNHEILHLKNAMNILVYND